MAESAVGTSIPRVDALEKLTGQARYAGDLRLPGMLFGRLVVSPYAHARVLNIDKSAAERITGVIVLTAADLPIANREANRVGEPLAAEEVLFNGHPVAVVLAESEAVAEDALSLVDVTYEPLPIVADVATALEPGAPRARNQAIAASGETEAHASVGGAKEELEKPASPNVSNQNDFHRGNIEDGFREADVVVEETYRTGWVHQSPIEPQTAAAWLDPTGVLTIWTSTQSQFYPKQQIAKLLGLPSRRVKVVGMTVGGGFGSKLMLIEPLIASVAMAVKRPVRLAFTRSEEYLAANRRRRLRSGSGPARSGTAPSSPSRRRSPSTPVASRLLPSESAPCSSPAVTAAPTSTFAASKS